MVALRSIAGAVCLLLVAGCSNSGESSKSSTTSVGGGDQVEFVSTANAICAARRADADQLDAELEERFGDSQVSPEEFDAALQEAQERLLPGMQTMVSDLEDLTPPPGAEEMWAEGLVILNSVVTELEHDPMVLGDPDAFAYPEGVQYGLTDCFVEPQEPKFVPIEEPDDFAPAGE